ncbi:hypothetical protein, partial [Thiolapillus sp.]|uniref:hypothetical protein n=1 Tax=Thiolapillus sp. TaxID=2017437 RepID=UPI003AF45902
ITRRFSLPKEVMCASAMLSGGLATNARSDTHDGRFNAVPQRLGLARASQGAYIFAGNVAPSPEGGGRAWSTGLSQAPTTTRRV